MFIDKVTFSNISTDVLAMVYGYKKFRHTELYGNSIFKLGL